MNYYEQLSAALGKFNKSSLGQFPTPVHKLEGFQKKFGCDNIWIKRDDMTGLAMGGNKVRTLEFIMGDAMKQGSDTILVSGPLQSNMCTLAVAAAKKMGMDCRTIHRNSAPERLEGNLLLSTMMGAEPFFQGKVSFDAQREFVNQMAANLKAEGKKPYVILKGGSIPLGALGYVSGAMELYRQIVDGGLNIKHVFMPAGHGGTVAGLITGAALLDAPFHIHVISVENTKKELEEIIPTLMHGIEDELGLNVTKPLEQVMTIYDDYMGMGYGIPTDESEAMVTEFAQTEGIFVEHVYTSKTMVGMLDLVRKKRIPKDDGVCYWHTGGLPSLFTKH